MDEADQEQVSSTDYADDIETQRSTIQQSLPEIANDVGIAMRAANLYFPSA